MKLKVNNLNVFLSTLNFALCFVGYQLTTSLFLPVHSDLVAISRPVTIPYRAFALLISLLVIFLNMNQKVVKIPFALKVLWAYWMALIIRIFYDTNIRIDVQLNGTTQLWLYIFGIILPTMCSVLKSFRIIDLNKAFKWVYIGTFLTMLLSLFNNPTLLIDTSEITGRMDGNVALNTISFGHLGCMGVILSLFLLSNKKLKVIRKIGIIVILLLSFFIMLRAGSRSPILALVGVLLFWLFSRQNNVAKGFFVAVIVIFLLTIFIEPILNFISKISPVIEYRLKLSLFERDSSGRDMLYKEAFQLFLDKPLFGKQFALFSNNGEFHYPHNIIIEAFMALGVFGGFSMLYFLWKSIKKAYFIIKYDNSYFWVCLILIQQIFLAMLGQFYYNQILNVLLVFVLLIGYNEKDVNLNTQTYEKKN